MKLHHVYMCCAISWCLYSVSEGKKILMVVTQQVSHVWEQLSLAGELTLRGHGVYMLLEENFSKVDSVRQRGVSPILYSTQGDHVTSVLRDMEEKCMRDNYDHFEHGPLLIKGCKKECSDILHNDHLMDKIRQEEFDLAVVDGFLMCTCIFLVPTHLGIPYIYMSSGAIDLPYGIPNLPSMSVVSASYYSPTNMTFIQRLKNTLGWLPLNFFVLSRTETPDLIAKFAPGERSLNAIIRKSALFIFTQDHVLSWPYVSLPNVIRTSGITIDAGKPLPHDLQALMDSSIAQDKGVILVTFGSTVAHFPAAIYKKLIEALNDVPQLVIFRVDAEKMAGVVKASDNVKLVPWIPQQDLLAHPNMRLFITHCGHNGQSEAVFHGVPMIGFPLFADQPHNCMRGTEKGVNVCMDIKSFSPSQLSSNIARVISDTSYRERARRLGRIMKSVPLPKVKIADNIEHVVEFGAEHLRSDALEMPLYQLLMLDVYLVTLIILLMISACIFCGISTLCTYCRSKVSNKLKIH